MNKKSRDHDFNENLRRLFNEEKWEDRAYAARNLGYMRDGRAVNLLVKAFKSEKNPSVINRIIEALGRIGHPKATMSIIEVLKREFDREFIDKMRLFYIIESLMKIGDERALAYLNILFNSSDTEIKDLTLEALDCIDPHWQKNIEKEIHNL